MNLSLVRTGLDATFSLTMLVVVGLLLIVALDPMSGEKAAHLWGRYLAMGHQEACPTMLGNSFWFSCASEVRRLAP